MPIAAVPLEARVTAGLPSGTAPLRDRVRGLDVLRGLVIGLMVVDHVRWFLSEARFDPTDPALTTPALFFTRWVTHFCAPAFMLLAGAGLLLEVTVARFGWRFNLDYGYTGALVFWALGWSMIALAGLVWLPLPAIAAIGVGMIAVHNLFDGVAPAALGGWSWLWTILHSPGMLTIAPGIGLFVLYPLVPWIGVMAAGYVFGALFSLPAEPRDRILLRLGLGLTAGFLLLRAVNLYGDPSPWSAQAQGWRTTLSFLNTTKYPASLLFLLMTLGPAIALLPWLERARGGLAEAIRTVGRVPLFFWLLHVPLIHLIAAAFSWLRYGEVIPWLVRNPTVQLPEGYGYRLSVVYAVSLAVVLMLYQACVWFAALKRRRRNAWLSYL